jgi:hypothetical protein
MAPGIRLWSGVMIAVLTAASARAETPTPRPRQPPPLQAGRSAGVKTAQQGSRPTLALVGAGAIIALVVMTTAGSGSSGASQPNSQSVPGTVP